MKPARLQDQGFTLVEMLLAVSIGSLMMAAIVAASVCLQRSFAAVDGYFASHIQQVRIIDYLSRDVKRSYIVTTSTDLQTVTCTLPNYLIDNGSNQPTRATPTLSLVGNKIVANYQATTFNNVTTAEGSVTISGPGTLFTAHFTSANEGKSVVGTGIPAGTMIQPSSVSCNLLNCQATMSNAATASNSNLTVTIGALTNVVYSVDILNKTIRRRENGALTNIAASADNLIPTTSDIELLNTEFTQSTVTFLPRFISTDPNSTDSNVQNLIRNERAGTTVFSLSYLRNKRRGDG